MSATQNLKTVFEADTRDLSRGAKQAKKELKDFGKTSNEVTQSIGDAFGVDLDKLNQLTNATKEWGRRLTETGSQSDAAFGKLLQHLDSTKVAIAGLGIGAAVGAFKLLVSEAEAFKNTVAGANIEMQTAAYVATYTQALHDFNTATGQSVAEFEAKWKKGFGRFWANFKQDFVNAMNGNMGLGQGLLGPIWGSFLGNKEQRDTAGEKASQAEQIAGQMFTLSRQLAAKSVEWAEAEAQIAEYRRIAKDDSVGLAAQTNAIAQATALINKRYGEEYQIRKSMSDLQTQLVGLTGSSVAEEDKMYQMQKQTADVLRQKETMIKSLNRDQKSINAAVAAEAEARRKAAEELAKQKQVMAERAAQLADLTISGGPTLTGPNQVKGPEMSILLHPEIDEKEVTDISKELASLVEQGVTSVSESIGSLIGDLATGGDAWSNFTNSAVSAFGDMAISVGKMAVSTGVATLGIKAALESLNGYVAIAAGAALIALGAAVKTGMSNIAGGNYSASSSVASSGYARTASGTGGYSLSSINVRVTGTLIGDGRQLKGVIDSENSRLNTVT